MNKAILCIIVCFALFQSVGFAGVIDGGINQVSKEDEEIIEYLYFLENYEFLQQELELMQEYEHVDNFSSIGE